MKTLESLLDADFDVKMFDYEPIKAEPIPGLDGMDWVTKIDKINQQIEMARTMPLLNQMVELAKEIMSTATDNGKLKETTSREARQIVFAARDIYKIKTLLPDPELEEQIRVANEFNELNNLLRKNKKFCDYIKKIGFWVYISIDVNDTRRHFFKFVSDERPEQETKQNLADFEALKLKVPNNFELKSSRTQDGSVIIKIYAK